ncbi:uncharacterized protein N7473_011091 [Penicillium subrubescens]|uniref:uncharacterized protein n=1 Tax=Penicillium subrubescens TaxID=1316194 RepID=UPI0025457AA3|nr:uncharacterized protein N7473_011091 [Penicillium subrubescens]KAJ5882829.1 hypothetical protein N7473_011091 [Penicillium subrubescens]
MNIQSLLHPSHPAAPSPTQRLSPTEKILIPYEIDCKSGSSSEAKRRQANAIASRQFRKNRREGIPLQVGELSVRVFRLQEDQNKYVVYPQNHVLSQCQALFGSEKSGFAPEQVFIVIHKISTAIVIRSEELDFLLRIMQTRLCSFGVFDTDEGRFIRLAIAFSRNISLLGVQQPYSSVKDGGRLVDLENVVPGTWEIKVRFPGPEVVCVRGSVTELTQSIRYEEPHSPPELN